MRKALSAMGSYFKRAIFGEEKTIKDESSHIVLRDPELEKVSLPIVNVTAPTASTVLSRQDSRVPIARPRITLLRPEESRETQAS